MMPDYTLAQLGGRLRKARRERGFTQEQLSDRAGISVRHIAKIEQGTINPSFEVLSALIAALGTSFEVVLCPADTPDEADLQELVSLYRACPPRGRRVVLAAVRAMARELTAEAAEQPPNGSVRREET